MTFFGSSANDAAFNAWLTDVSDDTNRGSIEGINAMMPLVAILVVFGGFMSLNQDLPETWTVIFGVIGTVVLVPPVEECFYRGLIFRNLYGKSRVLGYIASILAFSMIHIIGYIGAYSAVELLMACLQYLPAGLCLAWSYVRGGTLFTPIVIHAAINFLTIRHMR